MNSKWLWVGSVLVLVLSSVGVYAGLSNPYGGLFDLSLFGLVAAVISISLLSTFRLFRHGAVFGKIISAVFTLSITAVIITAFIDYRLLLAPNTTKELTVEQWRQDIDYLVEQLTTVHPGLPVNSQQQIEQLANDVKEKLPELTAWQIRLSLMKLVASLNEGHTLIPPQPAVNVTMFPVIIQRFKDAFVITDAASSYSHLIGTKVISFNGVAIEDIYQQLFPYIGMENPTAKAELMPMYFAMEELLSQLEIIKSNELALQYQQNGQLNTEFLTPQPWYRWALLALYPDGSDNSLPYSTKMRNTHYRTIWQPQSGILRALVTGVENNASGETLKQYAETLAAQLDDYPFDKFVLDIRLNRGGNNYLMRPLVKMLSEHPKLQKRGRFFTLISNRTYSAASNLASLLEVTSGTIFVGSSTGQGANQFGDPVYRTLPHSGIVVGISSKFWQGRPGNGIDQAVKADYLIDYYQQDFIQAHDPALAFIQQFSEPDQRQPLKVIDTDLLDHKYLFDTRSVAEIRGGTQSGYWLTASDYIEGSLNRLNTRLYQGADGVWHTDVQGLTIQPLADGNLQMEIRGEALLMKQVASDYQLPMQRFMAGDYKAGAQAIIASGLYQNIDIEDQLNMQGYQKLWNAEYQAAEAILELVTQLYPESSNAWDSLGEAAAQTGNINKSRQCYAKALALDPNNRNAKDMLARLGGGEWFND